MSIPITVCMWLLAGYYTLLRKGYNGEYISLVLFGIILGLFIIALLPDKLAAYEGREETMDPINDMEGELEPGSSM